MQTHVNSGGSSAAAPSLPVVIAAAALSLPVVGSVAALVGQEAAMKVWVSRVQAWMSTGALSARADAPREVRNAFTQVAMVRYLTCGQTRSSLD